MVFKEEPARGLGETSETHIEGTRSEMSMLGEDSNGMGIVAVAVLTVIGVFAIGHYGGGAAAWVVGLVGGLILLFGVAGMVRTTTAKVVESGDGEIAEVYMEYRRINDTDSLKWYPIISLPDGRQMWGATNNRHAIEHLVFEGTMFKITPFKVNIRGSEEDKVKARQLVRKGFYYRLQVPVKVQFERRESGWVEWATELQRERQATEPDVI